MADIAKLAPAFAKLAEAAQEISDIFAGAGGVLGKRAGEFDENGKKITKGYVETEIVDVGLVFERGPAVAREKQVNLLVISQ